MTLFVQFDPATEDIKDLPARIITALESSCDYEYLLPSFTRQISHVDCKDYLEIVSEYDITIVRKIGGDRRVVEIQQLIQDLTGDIKHGSEAWEEGTDECSMAECDPSDQYCKSMEIEELKKELKTLIV